MGILSKLLFFVMTFFVFVNVNAQPINPWLADGINRGIQMGRENDLTQYKQMLVVETQRAEIRRLKNTKFYGAIAMSPDRPETVVWGGGTTREADARAGVLRACGRANCKVVASFSNACAMIALPDSSRTIGDLFLAIERSPQRAIDKAYEACEEKFGKNNCGYLGRKDHARHPAYCVGYEYGVYSDD